MTAYTYTTIDDPSAANGTSAGGINDLGQIIGSYDDGSNHAHGFLYSGGIYTTIDIPRPSTLALTTRPWHQRIGPDHWVLRRRQWRHGFLYSGVSYTTIEIPRSPMAL